MARAAWSATGVTLRWQPSTGGSPVTLLPVERLGAAQAEGNAFGAGTAEPRRTAWAVPVIVQLEPASLRYAFGLKALDGMQAPRCPYETAGGNEAGPCFATFLHCSDGS